MKRKGIILAGGSGTRLHPLTLAVSKQLLPIFDKPMIYYALSVLMLTEIREILLISTPHDLPQYKRLLGDGTNLGIKLSYAVQEKPEGLAQAFIIGEEFLDGDKCALVLGDNFFYGSNFSDVLRSTSSSKHGATVFAVQVSDPSRYGVVDFDEHDKVLRLKEKPQNPTSNWAVTGLYFYDEKVCELAKSVKPSARGELEITDLNNLYLEQESLNITKLPRGFAWLDTGTHDSLHEASSFVQTIQHRTGLIIGCLEEIALVNGWIDEKMVARQAKNHKGKYGEYLKALVEPA